MAFRLYSSSLVTTNDWSNWVTCYISTIPSHNLLINVFRVIFHSIVREYNILDIQESSRIFVCCKRICFDITHSWQGWLPEARTLTQLKPRITQIFGMSRYFSQDLFVNLGICQNLPSGSEADALRNTVMSNRRKTSHFISLTPNTGCFNLLDNYWIYWQLNY